jgi:hypothetical protein
MLEGADAALAQHDVEVAALGDVFGRHQPLLDGGAHAPLEQDRPGGGADGLQQGEVLHVAGADLEHVGVGSDQVDGARVDHLGHHRQAGFRPHLGQYLQARLTQALVGVGGGAGLEGAAAQQAGAGRLGHAGGGEGLPGILDRARPGDHGQRVRADRHPADPDDRPVGVMLPADQLVGDGNPHHVQHAAAAAQVQCAELVHIPDQSHDGAGNPPAHERVAACRADQFHDRAHILLGGLGGHHHDHRVSPVAVNEKAPGFRPGASSGLSRQRTVWRATVRVPGR